MAKKAFSFDADTLSSIRNSALIALGGIAVTVIPVFVTQLTDYLSSGTPFDWRMLLTMCVSGVGSWVVASVRQYVIGDEPNESSNGAQDTSQVG